MKSLKTILLFFTIQTIFLQAQNPVFEAYVSLSAEKIFLDQTVDIQLDLKFPDGYHTDMAVLQEHLMRNSSFNFFPFSLASEPITSRKSEQGTIQETFLFRLQPESPGTYMLSFLDIPFYLETSPQKTVKEIISPIFKLEVEMPSSALNEIQPASPLPLSGKLPIGLSPSNTRRTKALFFSADSLKKMEAEWRARQFPWKKMGAAILGLLAGLIVWVLTRDRQLAPLKHQKKIKESAKAFKSLEQAHLLEKGQLSFFMEQLSWVLKKYLEEQAGLQAEVLTTDELATHVASKEIQKFFLKVDLVKFAGYTPSLEECQQAEALVKACLKQP
ncbi:hypothetical protein [Parachlamydia sp. AcF125]|uniref:hypothetical protein n=1 Tax=Parachlamydia sp. AcF125 TaxID=2795736 RepID=UPI001BC9183F|nr:hypothetical protein [Parachlamydia sp. AcF125]MBS4167807.1 hypothetical protein [Parachlamydia sp. AcF125]